ncbi:MAG: hypothetical protein OJF58_001139 [Enhydrobacter sp.]|jgi:hypothetical protein|nr:MAG: hypothetical protein OJF58_001139 [Enhydrobacter sp.]
MRSLQRKYVKKPIELMMSRHKASALRPEGPLTVERLLRSEVALHRLLASSRRAASTQMSTVRRAKAAEKMPRGSVAGAA